MTPATSTTERTPAVTGLQIVPQRPRSERVLAFSARRFALRSASTSPISERLRRAGGVRGCDRGGQEVDGRVEPLEVLAAFLAAGEVALDLELLGCLESAQRVGGELVPIVAVVAHGSASEASRMPIPSARSRRTFSRPKRIRPLTVPRGMLSISAISEWVKPPK